METLVNYDCIDTDNEIEVIIKDGKIDRFFINKTDHILLAWITIDDLQAAIQLAKDEIAELDRIELKLT